MKNRILALLLLPLILSCIIQDNKGRMNDDSRWYRLRKGTLTAIRFPQATDDRTFLPWTIQERITDFSIFNGRLFFTVNGYGLVALSESGNPRYVSTPLYNEETFKYKTMTSLIPVKEALLCHLYFNTTLFPFDIASITTRNENLIKLIPGENICHIQPVLSPTQIEKSGWELVTFLPADTYRYYCEWKLSSETQSEFDYSIYDLNEKKETKITRDDFREAYHFVRFDEAGVEENMKTLCRYCIDKSGYDPGVTTFHFLVKSKQTNLIRRLVHEAPISIKSRLFELITIHMFSDEQKIFALLPDGHLLSVDKRSGLKHKQRLPDLPEGFFYTGFFINNGTIFASWEETQFIKVGAAGLLVIKNVNRL
ncbi:MAG: hypothetical protein JW881_06585 [Spirochaetales bacterium]|nr:hypothetical protein [Spirochaetales bacterium]